MQWKGNSGSSIHAVTILTENDIEVLLHIGIDTVSLNGKGFSPKVKEGDSVDTGDTLIEFDMDYIAMNAKSLLTQIVITNTEGVKLQRNTGSVETGEDHILIVKIDNSGKKSEQFSDCQAEISKPIIIANPTGLHARPAGVLSSAARKF